MPSDGMLFLLDDSWWLILDTLYGVCTLPPATSRYVVPFLILKNPYLLTRKCTYYLHITPAHSLPVTILNIHYVTCNLLPQITTHTHTLPPGHYLHTRLFPTTTPQSVRRY